MAAADVAYVCCTSLDPSVLEAEPELLRFYYRELARQLGQRSDDVSGSKHEGLCSCREASEHSRHASDGSVESSGEEGPGVKTSHDASCYSFEDFMMDYRVAFLDYTRYGHNPSLDTSWACL